jgi:hypothetical protein
MRRGVLPGSHYKKKICIKTPRLIPPKLPERPCHPDQVNPEFTKDLRERDLLLSAENKRKMCLKSSYFLREGAEDRL